jgi:alpha,alpha-trehalase
MVDVYVASTGDVDFLRSILPTLFTEYDFWIENRTVTYVVDDYVRYGPELDVPRPESYREDLNTANSSSESIVPCPKATQSLSLYE